MADGRRSRCIVVIAVAAIAVAVAAGPGFAPGLGFQGQSSPAPNAGPAAENGIYVIGRCTTQLDPDQRSRNDNIAIAAEKLDGTKVQLGQEFSFNATVGERSSDLGYGPARVIVDGRSEPGIAGGICQLSSTLQCRALAGMEITERRAHYGLCLTLLPADATVLRGSRS